MSEFDIDRPSPDAGHEAIRVAVLAAISDAQTSADGVDNTYFLTDLLFSLLDGALASIDQLLAQVDELTARIAALEQPSP